jgi:hypothetical protein
MSKCECPLAGFCERHLIEKHEGWHKLCQNDALYREAWDAFRGPGQFNLKAKPLDRITRIKERVARERRMHGWIRSLRTVDDIGLGDTIARLSKSTKSREVKEYLAMLLKVQACKPSDAIERLNQKHRYAGRRPPMDGRLIQIESPELVWLPKPKHKRALLVVAPDPKPQAELQISRPLFQEYAKKYEADYIELTNIPTLNHGCANKYVLSQVAKNYEQTLLLDTDVIIMPGAPSIFDAVPLGKWGLVDDLVNLIAADAGEWMRGEWNQICGALGVETPHLEKAWNSGVVIAPPDAYKEYYAPPRPVPNVWCAEQHWHTYCLMQSLDRVHDLPLIWQAGFPWLNFAEACQTSHFIHLCGCHGPHENRLSFMRHFASGRRDITYDMAARYEGAKPPTWPPWWFGVHREKFLPPDRSSLATQYPIDGVGAEIGVLRGEHAKTLYESAKPRKLFLVDKWTLNAESDWRPRHDESWSDILRAACKVMDGTDGVEFVLSGSLEWMRAQPDDSLDWIYIDANHDYESVMAEIHEARRIVKSGGVIAGHDYTNTPIDADGNPYPCGVVSAVSEAIQLGYGELMAVTREQIPSWAIRNASKCMSS